MMSVMRCTRFYKRHFSTSLLRLQDNKPVFNDNKEKNLNPSRYTSPPLEELPEDIRAICDETKSKIGFIPNVFLAYAKRPEHFRNFMSYHDLLMKGPSGLSRAERESIVVVVSKENSCLYCVVAHGAALRVLGKDNVVADQIVVNWRTADLSPRLRGILEFASKVNEKGFVAQEEDINNLKELGLTDFDVWDIVSIAAFFGFSNRMAGFLDMRPNIEFYNMKR
ncbi:sestrin [Acrasis kona]|uniref:Sestrin n=1 Tax=Acrasis kona TaxID=1008807 RepID=A0AAW2ZEU5_9EUKA